MDLQTKPQNLPELNKFVKSIWPTIRVKRGRYYFYLISNDDATATRLAGLYSTTVEGMWPLEAYSFESWKKAIQDTLDDWQRDGERPVFDENGELIQDEPFDMDRLKMSNHKKDISLEGIARRIIGFKNAKN